MDDYKLASLARSCLKKKRYNCEAAALNAINKIHKERIANLRVYFCNYCLGYHLTHTLKRERNNDKFKSGKINKCTIAK